MTVPVWTKPDAEGALGGAFAVSAIDRIRPGQGMRAGSAARDPSVGSHPTILSAKAAHRPRALANAKLLWTLFTGTLLVLLVLAMPAFAQTIPENASAKRYGDGWECNIDYRLNGDACLIIEVPENAYKTNRSYGSGWECHHGFREVEKTACIAVSVPDGGYLDPNGERWHCLRGYLKVDDTCQNVVIPENAYLVKQSDWECRRGFQKTDGTCAKITVPDNGYLNGARYGQPWSCERGFFEQNGLCKAVVIPQFAHFDDAAYGNGWKCQRGYEELGAACRAIEIPANGHLDRSGNRWACNRNFQKSEGLCVLKN